jgi:uncharacterized RDD family membrane protein YckC
MGRAAAPSVVPRRRHSEPRVAPRGSLEHAAFGQRLGAILFDALIFLIALMLATFVVSAISKRSVVSSNPMLAIFYTVAIVLYALNFVLLPGRSGQTIGKRILGIRIVGEDGSPVGYTTLLLRNCVGYFISAIAAFIGFLWALWDSKRQAWHDKIARTSVVLAR